MSTFSLTPAQPTTDRPHPITVAHILREPFIQDYVSPTETGKEVETSHRNRSPVVSPATGGFHISNGTSPGEN